MKITSTAILLGTLLATLSGAAAARDNVSFSIYVGAPAYVAPAPVYYYPPPQAVYYAPPAVYYAPPAVYYAPRPWPVVRYVGWHNGYRHHR